MFKKIITAEDHEIENLGLINTLRGLQIQDYEFVSYCDEAYNKIKQGVAENNPYELLITDLGFVADHRNQVINTGQELIRAVRLLQPHLKIIVFSIEKKPMIIDDLFKNFDVNGFVSKGRNDGKELATVIKKVFAGETVIPQEIVSAIRNNSQAVTDYDIYLLKRLSQGWRQKEIEIDFKEKQIKPDSQSAIEKRLNELRETLDAKNNIEMIVMCKDLGIL
ncbi:response regulator transcription factor [Chryseobacterium sp.]|uniref:response regulator transcription factor n=1 Tax=Chryseobacterium sp. TaxID=1871047 RepID=UPI0011C9845A|nr:response regulator transcription factor [Chryseobacterium sp.]TXF78998.1 response regulator transcription factor [Chryseobacterium sp.]